MCDAVDLHLHDSWEWANKEGRRLLVRTMIQEVGVDVTANQVVWVKARPDFDVLFQFLNNLRIDDRRRFWIAYAVADEDISDIGEDTGQMATGVKIAFPMSDKTSTCLVISCWDKSSDIGKDEMCKDQ